MSMASNADATPADAARRVIDANSYLTLATADADGRPWATPVWFAERDLREWVWVSRMETRHSGNIAQRADVALAVFDSTIPVGSAIAVYVEAAAGPVPDAELDDALAVFNARSVARGLRPWSESDVTGAAPHRLFRAVASQVWVLDENERRVLVA
ncbi:pyridoxamine 5'-phosphate oxidase [Agromyces ramosus]|uniref:Pyridoxamine 5'-phosphate oxidase n=2 Tax=Agromyces ramosus TaxID=33879 RepID=A0A4Q7MB56_9MICO|nr:pyridoxamine 5'-phosphate oxidase [Agromyces ramosus]